MSTYINGVTDAFPEQRLFTPDFSFLTQVMSIEKQRYDRGVNQVRGLHNSIMNTPVTSADNLKHREEVFRKIQGELKNVAGLDLSRAENVKKATTLFDPLVNDRELIYDMNQTRKLHKAMSTMESYANSFDPDIRSKYREEARRYINYKAEDMRNAKRGDGSIYKTQAPDFIPVENVHEYLNKAAADQKLMIKSDESRGFYLVSTENGKETIGEFYSWAQGLTAGRFDRQFQMLGEVNVEDAVRQRMAQGVSREDAVMAVAQERAPSILEAHMTTATEVSKQRDELQRKIKMFENDYANEEMPEDEKVLYEQMQSNLVSLEDVHKQMEGRSKVLLSSSVPQLAQNIVGLTANMMENVTTMQWAQSYAMTHEKTEARPDQVKLHFSDQSFQMQKMQKQFEYDMVKEEYKTKANYALEVAKGNIKEQGWADMGSSSYETGDATHAAVEINKTNLASVVDNAFGAKTGLINYVEPDREKAMRYPGVMAKVLEIAQGGETSLSREETEIVKELGKTLGVNVGGINNPTQASVVINNLGIGIQRAYNASMTDHPSSKKSQHAVRYAPTALALSNNIQKLHSGLNDQQGAMRSMFLTPDNKIKPQYQNNAVITGKDATGKPIITITKPLDKTASEMLAGLMPNHIQKAAQADNRMYYLSNIKPEQMVNLMDRSDVKDVSINGEDVTAAYINNDKNLPFGNINLQTIAEQYGNGAEVVLNPLTQEATLTFKPMLTDDASKAMGVKGKDGVVNGSQVISITVPYSKVKDVLPSSSEVLQRNTFSPPQVTTSVVQSVLSNPDGSYKFDSSFASAGFDGTIAGGYENGQYGINFYAKSSAKGRKDVVRSGFIPMTKGKLDIEGFEQVDQYLLSLFNQHLNGTIR